MRKTFLTFGVVGALCLLLLNPWTVAWAQGLIQTRQIADNAITTAKIANGQVTLAKTGGVAQGCVAGRTTSGTGSLECLTAGTNITISGGTISASGGGGGSSNYTGGDYPWGRTATVSGVIFSPAVTSADRGNRITYCFLDGTNGVVNLPASPASGDTYVFYRPACANAGATLTIRDSSSNPTGVTMASNNSLAIMRWSGSAWAGVTSNGSTEVNLSELAGLGSSITRVYCLDCASAEGIGAVVVRSGNGWVTEQFRVAVTTSMATYMLNWGRTERGNLQTDNPLWGGCDQTLFVSAATIYGCFQQQVSGAGAGAITADNPTNATLVGGSGISTGTTTTGRGGWYGAGASTGGQLVRVPRLLYMRVEGARINTAFDATNDGEIRIGFASLAPGATWSAAGNVAVGLITLNTGGQYRLENFTGTLTQNNTTGTTPLVSPASHTIELLFDNAETSPTLTVYFNGTLAATNTTNLPPVTNTARWGPFIEIRKTAGTTARIFYASRVTYAYWLGHLPN